MINKLKNMLDWTSFKKGVKKGYIIPLLPDCINKIYNSFFFRVLRVIGGFSTILVFTKNYIYLPKFIAWIVLMFAIIQLIQIVIISIIKVIYGIRKLRKNPKDFEVRNSPLNKYASQLANAAYCWRVGCSVIGGGVGFIASSVALDQAMEAGGQAKIFLPIIGKGISFIFNNNTNQNPLSIYKNIQENIKELDSIEERYNFINYYIDKIISEDLKMSGICNSDKDDIKKVLEELSKTNKEELKVFRSKILTEIEKLKINK